MYYSIHLPNQIDFKVHSLEDLPRLKQILEVASLKPNFSLLARELGVDRRTIKKYYDGHQPTKKKTTHFSN